MGADGGPMWLRDTGVAIGGDVTVELAPEGPQRDDLAGDIATALAANPAAGAFFDTLAQFYRKAYLRWIDATTRRPGLRAARIAAATGPLRSARGQPGGGPILRSAGAVLPQGLPPLERCDHPPAGPPCGPHR